MSQIILDNINENLNSKTETFREKFKLSSSMLVVQNNDDENIGKEGRLTNTEETSEANHKKIQNSQKVSMSKTSADGGNTTSVIWQKLLQLTEKRQSTICKFEEASKCIRPCEFESYYEYFVLNTFKKGISASGHVDFKNFRRNHNKHRLRSRRTHDIAIRVPVAVSGSSMTLDSDDEEDEEFEKVPSIENRNGEVIRDESNVQNTGEQPSMLADTALKGQKDPEQHGARINSDISMSSIIPEPEYAGSGRRSTRLSRKNQRAGRAINYSEDVEENGMGEILVKDLYESLVPKVKEPYRRSDWILPSRLRYTPDKQMHTKVEYEKINLNELVSTGKIQRILSKFEGGITGIRKSKWNSVK